MELVVVVVGVLLALWAAEWAQDRRQARDDERIMVEVRKEVRDALSAMATYSVQEACWSERLEELRDQLSSTNEWEGAAMPTEDDEGNRYSHERNLLFPNVVRGWHGELTRDQFDRALDAGTIERLPEASKLRRAYRIFDLFEESQMSLSADLGEIRVLAFPRSLDSNQRFEMLRRLARMDNYMNYLRYASTTARDHVPAEYSEFTDEELIDHQQFVVQAREALGECVIEIDLTTGKATTK